MHNRIHSLSVLLALAALLLAACAPAGGTRQSTDEYYAYDTTTGASGGDGAIVSEADKAAYEAALPPGASPAIIDRLVIKNANLALVVTNPAESVDTISRLAEGLGGFVVSSNTYQASIDAQGNKIMQGYITVRVPVEKLTEAVAQIKGLAVTVNSETVSGEDVTAQYTDLESQLTNLEAAEAQLQKIMEGATKTEDVLAVYNQLVSVRGQIEQVKGQMKYYRESAAMSLISVDLIPDALSQPLQVAGWKPEGVVKEAFEALVRAFQNLATAGIWGVVYLLPLGLLILVPLYIFVRVALRRLRRKPPTAATA